MGKFYIDDSVHDDAGFIIGACVYTSRDLSKYISEILLQSGYDPTVSEFKSRTNYKKQPQMATVREELRNLFSNSCKFGLIIIPRNERKNLGYECINGIHEFISQNNLTEAIDLYFDEGLFPSIEKAHNLVNKSNFSNCNFHFEQNSIAIKGLQLADMAAHTSSIILKEKMGLIKKMVKVGENSGYNSELEMEIGFEMWASLRYNFFREKYKNITDDPFADATFKIEPFGLYIAESCDISLKDYARDTFGDVYLGCIH